MVVLLIAVINQHPRRIFPLGGRSAGQAAPKVPFQPPLIDREWEAKRTEVVTQEAQLGVAPDPDPRSRDSTSVFLPRSGLSPTTTLSPSTPWS